MKSLNERKAERKERAEAAEKEAQATLDAIAGNAKKAAKPEKADAK